METFHGTSHYPFFISPPNSWHQHCITIKAVLAMSAGVKECANGTASRCYTQSPAAQVRMRCFMQVILDLSSQRYIFISPGVQQFTCCPCEGNNNNKKKKTSRGDFILSAPSFSSQSGVSNISVFGCDYHRLKRSNYLSQVGFGTLRIQSSILRRRVGDTVKDCKFVGSRCGALQTFTPGLNLGFLE